MTENTQTIPKMTFVYEEENGKIIRLNLRVTQCITTSLDSLVRSGQFFSRSELVRHIILDYLARHSVCPQCGMIVANQDTEE